MAKVLDSYASLWRYLLESLENLVSVAVFEAGVVATRAWHPRYVLGEFYSHGLPVEDCCTHISLLS